MLMAHGSLLIELKVSLILSKSAINSWQSALQSALLSFLGQRAIVLGDRLAEARRDFLRP
jgi:hypothetical protein